MAKDKHAGGRPPKYDTAEQLQAKIDEYFTKGVPLKEKVITNQTTIKIPVPTITGLVLYLGYCDRQSFYDLEKQPKFSYTIKKARSRIENNYEELLIMGGGAGAIFALKNFGWVDKQETKITGDIKEFKIGFGEDE